MKVAEMDRADLPASGLQEKVWWRRYEARLRSLPITGEDPAALAEVLGLAGFNAPRHGGRVPPILHPERLALAHWRMMFVLSGRHPGLD